MSSDSLPVPPPEAPAPGSEGDSSTPPSEGSPSADAPPGDTSSAALLGYYRERCDEFEKERSEWLSQFSKIEASHEDLHRTRWELRARQDEVAELQQALSDSNVVLIDEREQLLKLQVRVGTRRAVRLRTPSRSPAHPPAAAVPAVPDRMCRPRTRSSRSRRSRIAVASSICSR